MNTRFALATLAIAWAAPCCNASTAWLVDISYSGPYKTIFDPGDTATITIWAAFDENLYAFAGSALDVNTEDPNGSWTDVGVDLSGPGSQDGVPVGGDVTDIIASQLHFPPGGIFADTANPIMAWHGTFSTTDLSYRNVELSTLTHTFNVYTDETGMVDSFLDSLTEGAAYISVGGPTPGSAATLALGSLVIARRRRSGPLA